MPRSATIRIHRRCLAVRPGTRLLQRPTVPERRLAASASMSTTVPRAALISNELLRIAASCFAPIIPKFRLRGFRHVQADDPTIAPTGHPGLPPDVRCRARACSRCRNTAPACRAIRPARRPAFRCGRSRSGRAVLPRTSTLPAADFDQPPRWHCAVLLRDAAREHHGLGDDEFGDAACVRVRRVEHWHAERFGGVDIDLVRADAGSSRFRSGAGRGQERSRSVACANESRPGARRRCCARARPPAMPSGDIRYSNSRPPRSRRAPYG